MINHKTKKVSIYLSCLSSIFLCSAQLSQGMSTVRATKAVLNASEFNRLQNQAGTNGTIIIPRDIQVPQTLIVTTRGLSIIGEGGFAGKRNLTFVHPDITFQAPPTRGSLNIVPDNFTNGKNARVLEAMFEIRAQDVKMQNLRIRGLHAPLMKQAENNPPVVNGLARGILLTNSGRNLEISNCIIRNVRSSIDLSIGALPHGLTVKNTTFSSMLGIKGGDRRPRGATEQALTTKMTIDNVDMPRVVVPNKNWFSNRAVTFDYGNFDYGDFYNEVRAINFRGSVIRECDLGGMALFAMDINRCQNITIERNRITCGNYRTRLVNALHFEAGARNITCRDNILTINKVAGNTIFGSSAYFGGIGGRSYQPSTIRSVRNTYRGAPYTILRHTFRNWTFVDEKIEISDANLPAFFAQSKVDDNGVVPSFTGSNNDFNKPRYRSFRNNIRYTARDSFESVARDKASRRGVPFRIR